MLSPAPRVFQSPSSSALPGIRTGGAKTGSKPVLGSKAKAKIDTKLGKPGRKSTQTKKVLQNHPQTAYPFKNVQDVDGASIIDFKNLPDSFIVGNDGTSPMFHNGSALDPDSGVLAGHNESTATELAVESILHGPGKVQVPNRLAIPPPQLSSTMIAHSTRSHSSGRK